MKKAKKFIRKLLKDFIVKFPEAKAVYEVEDLPNNHFIEITPRKLHHKDKKYLEWESNAVFDFIDKYPCDNICFISDDAIIKIKHKNAEIFEGNKFKTLKK